MKQSHLRLVRNVPDHLHPEGCGAAPARMATEIELTIKEFLLTKRQEQCSPGTLEKYAFRLEQLAAWLADRGATDLSDLSKLLLREWGASLDPTWKPATMLHAVTIVRGWLNWCHSENLTPGESLATALRSPKVKLRSQRTLSADEVLQLIEACDPTSRTGLREAAIVSLMVDSGLRATEVCRLKKDDLVFDFPFAGRRMNFIPILGKNGHEEPVYFGRESAARLRAWLTWGREPAQAGTLFISLGGNTPGRPLTRSGLGNLLERLGQAAGVPGVSPHALRRTFAMLLDGAGTTTRQIQALGRWSDIRMVERYTQAMRVGKNYHAPMDSL